MSAKSTPHRFRPRFLGMAFLSLSMGVMLVVTSLTLAPDKLSGIASGVLGVAGLFLGFAYLRSPVWRLAVEVLETELVVWEAHSERMRLPWDAVNKVVTGPEKQTLFVDGGSPEKSLLIPGPGAPASYDIRKKQELIEKILAKVPADKVTTSSEALQEKKNQLAS